jgi:acyl-CoA synthetase (NDP forming)
VHKFDVGGVQLNLKNAEEVRTAYQAIVNSVEKKRPEADIEGIYVQRMAAGGTEVILGLKRDQAFGPVLMFGLGGIYVEIYKDVEFGIIPLSRDDMDNMIKATKSYPLLSGARGRDRSDIDAIIDCMRRLSQLALDFPSIVELDINPLIVHAKNNGAAVADVKIVLNKDR